MLAMLGEDRFHPHQVLPEAVGLAQGLLVVVGDGGQERGYLDRVEAAERLAESLLAKVKRADIHT